MKDRRVVITGLGAVTPLGLTVSEYWQGLIKGESGAGEITNFDASKFKTRFACELKGFDPFDYIDSKEAKRMDPFCHFAIVSSDEAIKDSGLELDKLDRDRFGVVLGSGIGGITSFSDEVMKFERGNGTPRFTPFLIPRMIIDIAPGHVSIRHGLKGPNYSCVSACASSSHALMDSYFLIKNNLADYMLTGGSESAINQVGIGGFNAMKALSTRNDDPKTASRPFDLERDGFVMGEGGGAMVLETLESAQERGATIYAEICGVGMTGDAYHVTAPDPQGDGANRVMKMAVKSAGIDFTKVDYINVHGTSTPLGDIAETKAIKTVFGEHAKSLNISSTKSMTGHLLGAAGAIEGIATILAVKNDIVPPTINHFTDDPECDLNYTFNSAQKRTVNYALTNTFGFGGHNASILFKKVDV